jgi:XTP/dITP diphosphohydrolase
MTSAVVRREPILIATRSTGKLRELRPLFAAAALETIDLADAGIAESRAEDDLEVFDTFEDNALAKARYFHEITGRATVADDSGLCVDALDGRPGVLSKRWSGRSDLTGQALDDANNRLLLERLRGASTRAAHYVCVAAYVGGDGQIVRRGEVRGHIVDSGRGGNGFGYDPYFLSDELNETFGEAASVEKARVSHRARAFGSLIQALRSAEIGREMGPEP